MVSVKFNLSTKKRQDTQECELLVRLSVDREHVLRGKSGILIQEKFWNQKTQKVIVSRMKTMENSVLTQLQSQIDSLSHHIFEEAISTPVQDINKVWLQNIINKHMGKPEVVKKTVVTAASVKKTTPIETFQETLDAFIALRCKPLRATHFRSLGRTLHRFALYCGKDFELSLDTLTSDDLERFAQFFQMEHTFFDKDGKCIKKYKHIYTKDTYKQIPQPRGLNAVICQMKYLRTLCRWAVKTGRTTNNPFISYTIGDSVYGTPFFMTCEERDKLFAFDFSARPGLAVQRDIFVFQSNVGMRAGDMYELTASNIVNGAIEYVANKTTNESGRTIRVPLTKQAKTIIERYRSADRIELLPFIEMQPYNRAIKEMLRLCGINRIVTVLNPTTRIEEQHPLWEVASSHMARRNFIGNLFQKTQDPNVIGSMTGHVDGSTAFRRYRAIDDSIKQSLIDQL